MAQEKIATVERWKIQQIKSRLGLIRPLIILSRSEKSCVPRKNEIIHKKLAEHETPFDTIAENGYSGSLAHLETGTRSNEEASLTSKNVTKVKKLIERIIDHPNALK